MLRCTVRRTAGMVVLLALLLAAPCLPTMAQETGTAKSSTEQDKFLELADGALADLMAWRTSAAREQLEPKEKEAKRSPALLTAWGLLCAEEGNFDEAVKKLQQAANKAKDDPAPEYYRGEVLYWQRSDSEATAAWKAAHDRAKALVAASPKDARGQYYLGAALVRMKKYGEARKALGKAIEAGFDSTQANFQIGLSYAFEGNWQDAETTLSKVVKADKAFAHAYYYRGITWDKLKRKDNMLVDMDQFVKLAPAAPEAGKARSLLNAAGR